MKKFVIGVDIGATNLRVCLGNEKEIIIKKNVKTDRKIFLNQVISLIKDVSKGVNKNEIRGISIGCAGLIDRKRGMILNSPNLKIKNFPLVKPLRRIFKLPIILLNDCVAAVLGEKFFGKFKKEENLVYLTISSGIGAGIIINNNLLLGSRGNAHEVGHMVIDEKRRLRCSCGKYGHWEAYCSGRGIPKFLRLLSKSYGYKLDCSTPEEFFEKCRKKDKFALFALNEIGRYNSIGISNIVSLYEPSTLILGGAVALNNFSLIVSSFKKHISKYCLLPLPKIRKASLGEDVVLYGTLASMLHTKF